MKETIRYLVVRNNLLAFLEKKYRILFPKRIVDAKIFLDAAKGRNGIEIGGPSPLFEKKGLVPIYPVLKSLDGVNFSTNTVWEGKIEDGGTFLFGDKIGKQFIREATSLSGIVDDSYDLLLSCHSLEHTANPIKALLEWKRVLRKDGCIILVLPNCTNPFDQKRSITSFSHLIADYESKMDEHDTTHFAEVLELLKSDKKYAEKHQESLKIIKDNHENRCLHHHVFDEKVLFDLLNYCGFKVKKIRFERPYHLMALAYL